jgi:transposase-like protein
VNTQEMTKTYRLNQWTAIVRECRNSGQSVTKWCAENDINAKNYYYWLKKVRIAACESLPALKAETSQIVPLSISAPINTNSALNQNPASSIILRLDSITVEISNSASATLIENTMRAIQNVR